MMPTPLVSQEILASGVGSEHGSAAVVTTTAAPGPSAPGALSAAIPPEVLAESFGNMRTDTTMADHRPTTPPA